jgi:site-specific recombinase XerD
VSEVCNLSIEDIDLQKGFLYIQQAKNNKDRYVPMDPETVLWVKKWLEKRPTETQWAFPTLQGTQLDQRYLRDLCYRLSEESGVYIRDGKEKKKLWPHVWRHTCFTELIEEGFSIMDVQQLAGHSDLKTTLVYLSVRPNILAEKIRGRNGVEA